MDFNDYYRFSTNFSNFDEILDDEVDNIDNNLENVHLSDEESTTKRNNQCNNSFG